MSALLAAAFPKTVQRFRELNELKQRAAVVEKKNRLFGLTNFGATGDQLALLHFGLAMEFEKKRYWWMKPIRPLERG